MEHESDPLYESRYDIDLWHNIYQVMGVNKWIWWVPINPKSNNPEGHGIIFKNNCESSSEESEEEESEDDRPRQYRNTNQNENGTDIIERLTNVRDPNAAQDRNKDNDMSRRGNNGVDSGHTDNIPIHHEDQHRRDNLNNIVIADNTGQIDHGNGRNENNKVEDSKGEYSNRRNAEPSQHQDKRNFQYYDRTALGDNSGDQPLLSGGRADGERADSKSSVGQL
eukprot:CAMPEP_0197019344 /NCGR_PEP_ID=MMETSP1380-20130617/80646_1 /TAXON_ID=5936 /ORGANISM="Euplotes crassus, Strain CT5" /LENGTH=222 /DNA_ID=CAMNT_0042446747 /DNA_START=747 /DNA_END=1419 /DNA_ORIENTATION=+